MDEVGKLTVGPIQVPVFVDKDIEGFGCFEYVPTPRIRIAPLDGIEREMTLLHEVLHVFSEHYGLRLSESSVRVLEQVITQFILDNSQIAEDWLKRVISYRNNHAESLQPRIPSSGSELGES